MSEYIKEEGNRVTFQINEPSQMTPRAFCLVAK